MTATSILRLIGMTDEQTTCDACGKVELRGTMILVDEDGVEAGRYGTTCGSYLLGQKVDRRAARNAEATRRCHFGYDLNRARRSLAQGDLDAVRWELQEWDRGRNTLPVRDDERAALAALRMAVTQ